MMPGAQGIAALLYLAAAGAGWLSRRGIGTARGLHWILALGAAAHVLGFVEFHQQDPPVPLESRAAGLSLIGWLVVTTFLLSLRIARPGAAVGAWVATAAFALTFAAVAQLRWGAPVTPAEYSGAWSHAHVLLAAAGFGALGLSSVAGLGYLVKERALKAKRRAVFDLPSLESLDRLGWIMLSIGFPLLTLGVLTGGIWLWGQGGSLLSQHALLSLVAWAVYLVPVALRLVQGRRGRASARSVVVGFVVLAVAYLGSRVFEGTP